MNRFVTFAVLTMLVLSFSVCKAEETKTVEWYLKPENKVALETKLAECKNNPGEVWETPNCVNARMKKKKRTLGGKFQKVQEPAIPKF